MISLKIGGIIVAAFIAGAFVASPELRAYAANTVYSTDIVDGQVKTPDIATSAVTNSKIGTYAVSNSKLAANSVSSSKITDGTISYADLSRSFIAIEHRDDCNCGGTGWDPNGSSNVALVYDSRVTTHSTFSVSLDGFYGIYCAARSTPNGWFLLHCDSNIPNGVGLNYAIFNPPY